MTLTEMEEFFIDAGEKKFRAHQLFRRLYKNAGITDFDEVSEFSSALRQKLDSAADINALSIITKQVSSDGTIKYLLGVTGGSAIESVFMKYKYGNTICVSSQVGCRMGCSFCASGINGLERNLSAGEIVDQLAAIQRDTGERIGHIVVMGTGEPFDNYDELLHAIKILHEPEGLDISLRNITVSTCGLIEKIERFADDMPQVNLAISLHAANDTLRKELMPVAKRYSLSELIPACQRYTAKTHRRLTFEYALIDGKNDSREQALELAHLLKNLLCHVNIIPLNYVPEKQIKGSNRKKAQEFANYLTNRGIETTVRRELGSDISAACGQLRLTAQNADDEKDDL